MNTATVKPSQTTAPATKKPKGRTASPKPPTGTNCAHLGCP